jgi:hypothetical protein
MHYRTDGSLDNPPPSARGAFLLAYWREVEPAPGVYNWSALDADLTKAADQGVQTSPTIWIYDAPHQVPDWLHKFSPLVKYHRSNDKGALWNAPNYRDPAFHDRWQQLIRAFAAHIGELPSKVRNNIWATQVVCGITGDNRPWNGSPEHASDKPSTDEWIAYTRKIADTYIDAFKPVGVGVIANMRRGPYEQEDQSWFLQEASKKGLQERALKEEQGTMLAQQNGERLIYNHNSPLLLKKQSDGAWAHARGEFTSNVLHLDVAPWWNTQATAEWALTYGIDSWNLDAHFLKNKTFAPTLEFFNRHAGQKDPAKATAAFISFRDALDTLDKERWSTDKYGAVNSADDALCNKERMKKIVSENSKRGASLGKDDGYAYKDMSHQKNAVCIYDVGYDIFGPGSPHGYGNYGQHITQLDALGTSVGWWQLGPKHQPYGRFARGLEHSSGRSTITIELDQHFSKDGQKVTVKVVFFDEGNGRWSLSHNNDKVLTVQKGNSKKWKTAEVDITLAGRDLKLFSPDKEDVVFSLVEVLKDQSAYLAV